MRQILAIGIVIIFFMVVGISMGQEKPESPEEKMSLKVGIVNMAEVFDKYKKSQDLEKKLNMDKNKINDDLKKRESKLKKIESEIGLYKEGSSLRNEKELEYIKEKATYQYLKAKGENEIANRYFEYSSIVEEEAKEAVKTFGKEKGYGLILMTEDAKDSPEKKRIYTVWFYSSSIDISSQIIERLNKKYQGKK